MTEMPGPEYLVPPEPSPQVFLAEPDERWATEYAAEEALLRAALGPVLRTIDHAGSTSVPELPAKPVIDIVLTVLDPSAETAYVQPLASAGYAFHLREQRWHQHRLFKKGTPHFAVDRSTDAPRVNLHVFPEDCEEVRRMLAFRDRLIADEADRLLYAESKRRLAQLSWDRVQDYADAKADVVAQILERAVAQPSKRDGSPAPTRTTSG